MSKKVLFILVIIILLAPTLTAAQKNKPKEIVYIRPWSNEITISTRMQEGVARMGWGNCSSGLAADWVANTRIHLELYDELRLIQTVDTEDASWVTNPYPGSFYESTCMHAGQAHNSYWDFSRLRIRRPGDYILRFTVETTIPMTDGADYNPVDGVMDLYPSQIWFDEAEILIHVVR